MDAKIRVDTQENESSKVVFFIFIPSSDSIFIWYSHPAASAGFDLPLLERKRHVHSLAHINDYVRERKLLAYIYLLPEFCKY